MYTLALSQDGQRLFSAGLDQQIKLWCLKTQTELMRLEGHSNVVYTLRLDEVRKVLYSGSEDGSIRVWDTGKTGVKNIIAGLNSALSSLIVRPDGLLISVDSEKREIIRVYNLEKSEFVGRFDGHRDEVFALEMTKNGKRVFSAGNDRCIRIWDFETKRSLKTILAHSKCINCLLLTENNKFLFSCSDDCLVKIWRVTDNNLVIYAGINHGCQVLTIKLSRDCRLLFSGGKSSKPVKTWDVDCLHGVLELEEDSKRTDPMFSAIMYEKKEVLEGAFKSGEKGEEEKTVDQRMSVEESKNAIQRKKDRMDKLNQSVEIDEDQHQIKNCRNMIRVVPVEEEESMILTPQFFPQKSGPPKCSLKERLVEHLAFMDQDSFDLTKAKESEQLGVLVGRVEMSQIKHNLPAISDCMLKLVNNDGLKGKGLWVDAFDLVLEYLQFKKQIRASNETSKDQDKYIIKKGVLLFIVREMVRNFEAPVTDLLASLKKFSGISLQKQVVSMTNNRNQKTLKDRMVIGVDSDFERGRKLLADKHTKTPEKKIFKKGESIREDTSLRDFGSEQQISDVEKKDLEFLKGLVDHTEKIKAGLHGEGPPPTQLLPKKQEISQTKLVETRAKSISIEEQEESNGNCYVYQDNLSQEQKNDWEEFGVVEEMITHLGGKVSRLKNRVKGEIVQRKQLDKSIDFLQRRKRKMEKREYLLRRRYLSRHVQFLQQKERNETLQRQSRLFSKEKLDLREESVNLERQISELKNNCISLKSNLVEIQKKKSEKELETQNKLARQGEEIETVRKEMESLIGEKEKLRIENRELKEKGLQGKSQMETNCFEDFIGFLKKENTSLKEDYGAIKRKYEELKENSRTTMYDNRVMNFEKTKLSQEKTLLFEKYQLLLEQYEILRRTTPDMKRYEVAPQEILENPLGALNEELNISPNNSQMLCKRDEETITMSKNKPKEITQVRDGSQRTSVSANNTRFIGSISSQKHKGQLDESPCNGKLLRMEPQEEKIQLKKVKTTNQDLDK